MTLEERIKSALGEYQLQLMSLATQLEDAQKKIKELEAKNGPTNNPGVV